MHTLLRFDGIIDSILQQAVRKGLAKTKTEALRLGVLELNNRYALIGNKTLEQEDKEDLEYALKAEKRIAAGKLNLRPEKQLRKILEER